jgi:hypothetical protein
VYHPGAPDNPTEAAFINNQDGTLLHRCLITMELRATVGSNGDAMRVAPIVR